MNFSHAPCPDLSHAFLSVLTKMMVAQAQECAFERRILGGFETELGKCASIAQEAAKVNSVTSSTPMVVYYVRDIKHAE